MSVLPGIVSYSLDYGQQPPWGEGLVLFRQKVEPSFSTKICRAHAGLEVVPLWRHWIMLPDRWQRIRARHWQILAMLVTAHAGGFPLSKGVILDALFGDDESGGAGNRVVDVHICHLRKVIAPFGIDVINVWGWGYQLVETSSASEAIKNAA